MAGKADVANFALRFGFERGLQQALLVDPLWVVGPSDVVKLPQVNRIGLQPAQALFEVGNRSLGVAARVLGH